MESQSQQTIKTTKNGTSHSSDRVETQAKPKRGRPKKTETTAIADNVVQDIGILDRVVTTALNSSNPVVLVTKEVLKAILQERYKDDRYIIYRNVQLHDHNLVEENIKMDAMDIEEKVHGKQRN